MTTVAAMAQITALMTMHVNVNVLHLGWHATSAQCSEPTRCRHCHRLMQQLLPWVRYGPYRIMNRRFAQAGSEVRYGIPREQSRLLWSESREGWCGMWDVIQYQYVVVSTYCLSLPTGSERAPLILFIPPYVISWNPPIIWHLLDRPFKQSDIEAL